MHAFSVAPFDQNLSIDGKILNDDCATLGALGVIPESVILLKVSNSCPAVASRFQCCTPGKGCTAVVKGLGLEPLRAFALMLSGTIRDGGEACTDSTGSCSQEAS